MRGVSVNTVLAVLVLHLASFPLLCGQDRPARLVLALELCTGAGPAPVVLVLEPHGSDTAYEKTAVCPWCAAGPDLAAAPVPDLLRPPALLTPCLADPPMATGIAALLPRPRGPPIEPLSLTG